MATFDSGEIDGVSVGELRVGASTPPEVQYDAYPILQLGDQASLERIRDIPLLIREAP